MYVLALSDYKQHAATAGYKPAPQLGKKLLNIGHINYFFRKEVTTKRDTKEEKETFKSQFNVSNSKKRALSFIQNNKARILYMAL